MNHPTGMTPPAHHQHPHGIPQPQGAQPYLQQGAAPEGDSPEEGRGPSRHAGKLAAIGAIVAVVGIVGAVWMGGPVLGRDIRPLWMVAGGAAAAAGALAAAEGILRGARLSKWFWCVAALLLISSLLGLSTTRVVGGRPVFVGSNEAKTAAFIEQTVERLNRIAEIDALFDLNQVQGNLKIAELEQARAEFADWVREYGATKPEDLPSEDVAAAELLMESTTVNAVQAIEARIVWLKASDPVARAQADSLRQAMAAGVLETGALLADIGQRHGIPVGPTEKDAVE